MLRGALATAGQLPNFLGVLAGSPAALRGYARLRSELRHGALEPRTLERIALAVAEHYGSEPGIAMHSRTARAGRACRSTRSRAARQFASADEREAALLRYLRALIEERGRPPMHLHEEAREAGWTDEQLLEAIACVALESVHRDDQRRRRRAGRRLQRAGAPAGGLSGRSAWMPELREPTRAGGDRAGTPPGRAAARSTTRRSS